jgi:hypothetical protein
VNQADADWLAGRYATLGVALPDRLAYSGTFEKLTNAVGLNGRWQAGRDGAGKLVETGNFTQHGAGYMTFLGTGAGASKWVDSTVTIRNQNSAEAFDSLNVQPRTMKSTLSAPIDLGLDSETYLTFLVRENLAALTTPQSNSLNRTLALELLDANGQNQYDFSFHGKQTQFGIRSQADAAGQDEMAGGFNPFTVYLFVAKISGNGAGGTTLEASLIPNESTVGNFTRPDFPWMMSVEGGAGFNPVITQLQFRSLFESNFTVSNVRVGAAAAFFTPPGVGDFNGDGKVDHLDLGPWGANLGMTSSATSWDGDADGDGDVDGFDLLTWQQKFGTLGAGEVAAWGVPEPGSVALGLAGVILAGRRARRNGKNS